MWCCLEICSGGNCNSIVYIILYLQLLTCSAFCLKFKDVRKYVCLPLFTQTCITNECNCLNTELHSPKLHLHISFINVGTYSTDAYVSTSASYVLTC